MVAALNVTNALFMVVSALFTMGLYRLGVSIPGVFLIVGILIIAAMVAGIAAMPEFGERSRAVMRWRGS